MSYFSSKFNNREKLINRSLKIDEELYSKLENLSKNVYEASISKLVNASIENLLETEKIQIYEIKKNLCIKVFFS